MTNKGLLKLHKNRIRTHETSNNRNRFLVIHCQCCQRFFAQLPARFSTVQPNLIFLKFMT